MLTHDAELQLGPHNVCADLFPFYFVGCSAWLRRQGFRSLQGKSQVVDIFTKYLARSENIYK